MSHQSVGMGQATLNGLRGVSLALLVALAAGATLATGLAAAGVLPWLSLSATYGDVSVTDLGMYLQIGLSLFAIAMCFFIPANTRMLKLENAHRDFSISMEDVARAYQVCHAADRTGAFSLSSEFDSVRERMSYLRDHPDLRSLEPAVLEVAAQMSHESRDLAEIYSDDKMARARMFLRQRQQEIDTFSERMAMAKQTISEIRRWSQQVNVEEAVQATQLERLEKDLLEVLPGLGFELDEGALLETEEDAQIVDDDKVVTMAAKPLQLSQPNVTGAGAATANPAE